MDDGLLIQYAIVGMVVLASALFVVRKQFPGGVRRLRVACAVPLVREGRAKWMQRVGHWLAPVPRSGAGCDGCNGCDP